MRLGYEHLVRTPFWGISVWRQEGSTSEDTCVSPISRMLTLLSVGNYPDLRPLHKQKAEWLYSVLNYSCVCEQFCHRIGMGKIEVEGVLSLEECNLNIRKRAWNGIHSL